MGEQRFVQCEIEYGFANTINIKKIDGIYDMQEEKTYRIEQIVDKLNEQQELIEELQVSDEMGWKRAEHFEKKCPKELHNKKMYIKRLEYKVQKFKEMNGEQQATIQSLKERLYDFEKRKIIEESEIDEDVIPKVKMLRTELFGERYEWETICC